MKLYQAKPTRVHASRIEEIHQWDYAKVSTATYLLILEEGVRHEHAVMGGGRTPVVGDYMTFLSPSTTAQGSVRAPLAGGRQGARG